MRFSRLVTSRLYFQVYIFGDPSKNLHSIGAAIGGSSGVDPDMNKVAIVVIATHSTPVVSMNNIGSHLLCAGM